MKCDVVVVGAGILGLTSAYHLLRSRPGLDLLVIDRMADAGQGNTARSSAQFRDVFSSGINHALADSSADFYFHLEKKCGRDLGIQKFGYLWLVNERLMKKYSSVLAKVRQHGVDVSVLDRKEISRLPGLITDVARDPEAQLMGLEDLAGGFLGRKCGGLSAEKLVAYYKDELAKMKAKMLFRTEAKRLLVEPLRKFDWPGEPYLWQDAGVVGVDLRGELNCELRADLVVNATGAWSNELLDNIGIDACIEAQERDLYVISTRSPDRSELRSLLYTKGFNDEGVLPYIQLYAGPGSLGIRPQAHEETFWINGSSRWTRSCIHCPEPDLEQYQASERAYNEGILRAVSKYFPQFSSSRRFNPSRGDRKWAGLYTMNSIDGTPYIFRQGNLIVVTGCSGSGIMKADAIGRVVDGLARGEASVELFTGARIRASDLGVEKRHVDPEDFVL